MVLAGEGLLLALSVSLLRLRELSLFGLFYVLLAQAVWTFDAFGGDFLPPWWNPCLMLALSLGLSWWWQRQKAINAGIDDDGLWQLLRKLPTVGKNVVLFAAMQVAVVLAGGWNINQGVLHYEPLFWVPAFIGVLMMLDAVAAHLQDRSPSGVWLRGQPAYSAAVAMVIWLALTWHNTRHEVFPLVIAAEGLLLTLSIYVLRVREIAVLAQGYVVLGQFAWIVNSLPGNSNPPWWNPILLIGITLALSHWWQKLRFTAPVSNESTASTEAKATLDVLRFPSDLAQFCQLVYALAIVAILYLWLSVQMQAPAWLVVTSLLAIGLTVYGIVTRSWWLAAFGQIFLLISTGQFIWQLTQAKPNWPLPLAPVFALGALSFGTVRWFASRPDPSGRVSTPLLQLAMVYRWVSLAMSIWWVCAYVTERERIWVLASLGLLVFVLAGWRRNHEALFFSAAFTASALILFWLPLLEAPSVYVPNLLIILIILAQREIAHRFPERYSLEPAVHTTVIVVGCLSLWLFISRWVLEQEGGFYLTASWSVLALGLFGAGMLLHERVYRWVGLAVLSCALGRIVIIDVWKLETIYRVLSFLALGLVLLVLGFIYNKYQARIKEWL